MLRQSSDRVSGSAPTIMQAPAAAGGGQKRKISVLPRCVYEDKARIPMLERELALSHP